MRKYFEHDAYLLRVYDFAAKAHAGQKRRYTGEDYINHPAMVALKLGIEDGPPKMMAAALLHDVIEDCGVTSKTLRAAFGNRVADWVVWLSDDPTIVGNRKTRKAAAKERLSRAPPEVKVIKLADLIHNGESIIVHDHAFSKVFFSEMKDLLTVLKPSDDYGDPEDDFYDPLWWSELHFNAEWNCAHFEALQEELQQLRQT